MGSNVVDVDAIHRAAQMMGAEDGPIAYVQNAIAQLQGAYLSSNALTFMGRSAVTAHNDALDSHLDNLTTGAEHLAKAAEQLDQAASNWEASDQPWVVK